MTVKFGNYRLIRKIATGGMAEVWLAEQEGIEGFSRKVVVKRILPHLAQAPTFVLMFLNEARVASQLSHHNIVQIHDLGERGGEYFLAMEYIHGRDLGRVMQRSAEQERWVSCAVALRMVADACAGLYYAHTREDAQGRPLGLIHRDISAQNILVSFNGSVKLVDFGIAKAVNQSTGTQVGTVKGKFAYMSPEQAMGAPLDARSDIFSLGLVLYELLTAVRPFKRDNDFATWKAATQGEIRRPSEVANVSPYLDALVMRALEKKAGNRYPDASEFQMAIEEYLVENGLLVTSLHVADELTELFPEWQEEKAQLGAHIFPGQVSEGEAEELTPVGDEGIEGGGGGGFGGWLRQGGRYFSLVFRKRAQVYAGILGVVLLLIGVGAKLLGPAGESLRLSISTIPSTQVYMVQGEGKRVLLGETPWEGRSRGGAGGKLLLVNEASGIHYELVLPLLGEGEVFSFQKRFEEGRLKILTEPEHIVGVEIFRKGTQGPFAMVGLPIHLYEGVYELEFRGKALRGPVAFRVEVKPGGVMTQVTVDLSSFLIYVP